jgi:hypothetical protein
MSTRCQILVQDSDVILYRHCDGYPDGEHGVMALLRPLVLSFLKHRGFDPSYMSAQIVAAHIEKTRNGPTDFLGCGVEAYKNGQLHGDIEFLYVVTKNAIEVRSVQGPTFDETTVILSHGHKALTA